MTTATVQPIFTVEQAAKLLSISRTELYHEIRRGRLRSFKRGKSRRIPAEWLNEYRKLVITEGIEG